MADFAVPISSANQVRKAGKALRGELLWHDGADTAAIIEIFRIANNWRDAHAYPMRRVRAELGGKIRRSRCHATTAARQKRMQSIRKKLKRETVTLLQIQDLGGCRVILDSMEDANKLVGMYRDGCSAHILRQDRSYNNSPRSTGYRSHHFVLEFTGGEEKERPWDGLLVELQIRSQLQHVWATAVEAIGLVRKEDLKAGEGDGQWLRLFALMSGEFASIEGTAPVPYVSESQAERRRELREIDKVLNAVATLESLKDAIDYTDSYISPNAKYFLIQYDAVTRHVDVTGYVSQIAGAEKFATVEKSSTLNSVLVEVDKVEDLKTAYPNYYLDVTLFAEHVKALVTGKPAPKSRLAPVQPVVRLSKGLEKPDKFAWIKTYRRPRRGPKWGR